VQSIAELSAQKQQPRQASVGGLGDLTLDVEVEDRLGRASTHLGQASPPGIAGTQRPLADIAVADEVDVDVLIGRPMPLEVFEEGWPVERQLVGLEIGQGKGEGMVNANQGGRVFRQSLRQVPSQALPGPILARARRRWDLDR